MSEKSVDKQFGARTLTDEEVKLTLPTYEKLLAQIEEFRKAGWNEEQSSQLQNQKINNISIIGARGTGKTSILKTLISGLEKMNSSRETCPKKGKNGLGKNIMLPLIVPETMSEGASMMSMILGLFKQVVDKIEKEENRDRGNNCWEKEESEVVKRYKELVKKFCLIQPDYKQISVKEYTTENDYVRKSSEIYQADCEFLSCFHAFIHALLKYDKDSMQEKLIFIFIDDIDLCTHRSVEIVRTLLAYLSHPRIVTVISGDLETFEEAITLDLIRKDNVLREDMFKIAIVQGKQGIGESYLERKKQLTFEYLRKILPPIYRHNVLKWSLETRGNYFVKDSGSKSLGGMLQETFGWVKCPPIVQYYKNNCDEPKNLPAVFHLFDNTSRGLNAVYGVMLDLYEASRKPIRDENRDTIFLYTKQLLETIVGSNPLLNNFRDELLNKTISFGTTFETTSIDFGWFLSRLDSYTSTYVYIQEEDVQLRTDYTLFHFLDFAIRVLDKPEILDTDSYKKLESVYIDYLRLVSSCNINKHKDSLKMFEICSFPKALILFQLLDDEKHHFGTKSLVEMKCKITACFYEMLQSYSSISSSLKGEEYPVTRVMSQMIEDYDKGFDILRSLYVGDSATQNTITLVFSGILERTQELLRGKDIKNKEGHKNEELGENQETAKLELLINSVFEKVGCIFGDSEVMQLNEKEEEYRLEFEKKNKKRDRKDVDLAKRLEYLLLIDSNNLWNKDYAMTAVRYVKKAITDKLLNLSREESLKSIDISSSKDSMSEFYDRYHKFDSKTKVKDLCKLIKKVSDNKYLVDFELYLELKEKIGNLADNKNVWYGSTEAVFMLASLDNARFVLASTNQCSNDIDTASSAEDVANLETQLKEIELYLHFYARYRISEYNSILGLSGEITEYSKDFFKAVYDRVKSPTISFEDLIIMDEKKVPEFARLFS